MVLIKLVCPAYYTDISTAHPSVNRTPQIYIHEQFTSLKLCNWKKKKQHTKYVVECVESKPGY